jgi:hypothetical protein
VTHERDRLLVSCHWGNDNALRFYLAQGMWVLHWKHEIHFATWRDRPPLQMKVEGSRAHFLVHDRVVGVADNRGDHAVRAPRSASIKFSM